MGCSHDERLPQQWVSWVISQLDQLQSLAQGDFTALLFVFQLHLTSRGELRKYSSYSLIFFFLFPQIVILFSILDFLHLFPDPPRREGEYVGAGNEKNKAEK